MSRVRHRGRFPGTLVVSLGLYAVVLLASPTLHHDFACHLKSPGHCPACIANPPTSGAESTGALGAALFVDFGRAITLPAESFLPRPDALSLPGRSPPR
jgi:hypothetical protein